MADVTQTQEETETPATAPEEVEKPEAPEGEGEESAEGGEEEAKPEESEDAEAKADGEEDKAEPQAEAEEKRKRVGGWQRKIEKLKREREILLQQLESQRPAAKPSAKPDSEKTPEEKAADYIDSLVEKRLTAREEKRRADERVAEFQRRTAEVRAKNPDFDDVVMSADVPVSPALEHALLTSEHGPAIMYQLAKSPAELARINALPPLDAAREIGRLEAKTASSTAAPVKPKPAIRPPAPPTNVNGSASSTRSLDDLPISEYKRAFRSGRR